MKRALPAVILLLLCRSARAEEGIVRMDTVRKELQLQAPVEQGKITVDNVFGYIHVRGVRGNRIRLVAKRLVRSDSEASLAEAMQAVHLDVEEEKNGVTFTVDGPFRTEHRGCSLRDGELERTRFRYDFDIEAPADANVELKTVDNGDITVEGMHGGFHVENVNGCIEVKDARGPGDAYALNGDLTVSYAGNPSRDCRFGSLNGEVTLYFQDPLSADFRIKTFNGEAYSDFPFERLPSSWKF